MYLRKTKRKNKNGTTTEYYQLAHNERHPDTKKPVARIIHNFGRADTIDKNELIRLCKSIARVCDLEVIDSAEKSDQLDKNQSVEPASLPPSVTEATNADTRSHIQKLEELVAKLQESEEKYKTIFDNANDEIAYMDVDGTIIEINDKVEDLFGYTREEVIGKNFVELGALDPEDLKSGLDMFERSVAGTSQKMKEIYAYRKDGTRICIEGNASIIKKDNEIKGLLVIIRDVTERKSIEQSLQQYRDHLEDLVRERTDNLEEANTALKVLLKRREDDKVEVEDHILVNVKELVVPFLEKLKNSPLNDKQKTFVDIMEYNLNDIISPFVKELSSKYLNLTPTQIKIANIIKQGKTTKEIADMLNMSTRTIDIHRYNIRKKLGLNNKKASLSTFLMSLK